MPRDATPLQLIVGGCLFTYVPAWRRPQPGTCSTADVMKERGRQAGASAAPEGFLTRLAALHRVHCRAGGGQAPALFQSRRLRSASFADWGELRSCPGRPHRLAGPLSFPLTCVLRCHLCARSSAFYIAASGSNRDEKRSHLWSPKQLLHSLRTPHWLTGVASRCFAPPQQGRVWLSCASSLRDPPSWLWPACSRDALPTAAGQLHRGRIADCWPAPGLQRPRGPTRRRLQRERAQRCATGRAPRRRPPASAAALCAPRRP
jgi:hypothetical protein